MVESGGRRINAKVVGSSPTAGANFKDPFPLTAVKRHHANEKRRFMEAPLRL